MWAKIKRSFAHEFSRLNTVEKNTSFPHAIDERVKEGAIVDFSDATSGVLSKLPYLATALDLSDATSEVLSKLQ